MTCPTRRPRLLELVLAPVLLLAAPVLVLATLALAASVVFGPVSAVLDAPLVPRVSSVHGTATVPVAQVADPAPWVWPTGSRVVERPWEAPDGDYGPGHRGIDVAAALGTPAVAVDDGTVTFAGQVAGRSVVTIDHGSGLVSTVDSVVPAVTAGQQVTRGSVVGTVAVGHCPASAPCVHLGARLDDRYVDPMPYLPRAAWPVLLPDADWPG